MFTENLLGGRDGKGREDSTECYETDPLNIPTIVRFFVTETMAVLLSLS